MAPTSSPPTHHLEEGAAQASRVLLHSTFAVEAACSSSSQYAKQRTPYNSLCPCGNATRFEKCLLTGVFWKACTQVLAQAALRGSKHQSPIADLATARQGMGSAQHCACKALHLLPMHADPANIVACRTPQPSLWLQRCGFSAALW